MGSSCSPFLCPLNLKRWISYALLVTAIGGRNHPRITGKQWPCDFEETSSQPAACSLVCKEPIGLVPRPLVCKEPIGLDLNISVQDESTGAHTGSSLIIENNEYHSCTRDNLSATTVSVQMEGRSNDTNGNLEVKRQNQLLNTPVINLIHIHDSLNRLHEHLSINDNWMHLAGIMGLSTERIAIYNSLIRNRPALPGKTFCTEFLIDTRFSLGSFLSALLDMSHTDNYCHILASELWRAAWKNNAGRY